MGKSGGTQRNSSQPNLGPRPDGHPVHLPVGDDVPLVHHHQLEEHHEARHEVVEVAAAVPRRVEIRVLESDVAARPGARGLDVSY